MIEENRISKNALKEKIEILKNNFYLGEPIFYINETSNKVSKGKIFQISCAPSFSEVQYKISHTPSVWRCEDGLFRNKEEIIQKMRQKVEDDIKKLIFD